MNKNEFDELKFEIDILPSGYINISNKLPFRYNGRTTLICYKGGTYIVTTNHKTIPEFLNGITELFLVSRPPTLQEMVGSKVDDQPIKEGRQIKSKTIVDQPLAEQKPTKKRAPRKPKSATLFQD
jgi:hypothetical protein